MSMHKTHWVYMADDRKLADCEYGGPHGKPVFYFHGTPGSRLEPVFEDEAGRECGFRLIAPDRPGIGKSDYVKVRKLLGTSARWLSPRGFMRSLDSSLREHDKNLLKEEAMAEFFREDIVEAFRQ